MNAGASTGRIPEKVLVRERASVTAGFANEVEAVNQYAAVMYAPTANGVAEERVRATPQITEIRPKVAINSLKACAAPERACVDMEYRRSPNMRCATATPEKAPISWAPT